MTRATREPPAWRLALTALPLSLLVLAADGEPHGGFLDLGHKSRRNTS